MPSLSTITDGKTHADVRLGETFLVFVDRTPNDDTITVRVFHPDAPETVVGEHCFDVDLDAIETPLDAESSTNPTSANREGALG
jgi:endonuclease YncB( thermonuclease family)